MASRSRPAAAAATTTTMWSLLLFLTLAHALTLSAPVSTVFVADTNTQIAINLPPNSTDINFYVNSPDWYQYTAIGFGSRMDNSLLLVAHTSANGKGVTVSPRRTSDHTEPVHDPSVRLTLHPNTAVRSTHFMVVNGTCHGCRSFIDPASTSQPLIFAVGPGIELSSDSPSAFLRRHIAHGHLSMDMVRASGAGGIPAFPLPAQGSEDGPYRGTEGGSMVGGLGKSGSSASTAHGVVFVVAALLVAPVDSLIAGTLSRWPILHGLSATVYLALVIGAFVPGIMISRDHAMTRTYTTPHQILGLLSVGILAGMFVWGAVLAFINSSAKKRGQPPPQRSALLGTVHRWTGRLVWVLFVINGGVGLKLAERSNLFMMGYGVLIGAIVVIGIPIWFCVWRWQKYKREKLQEESHELNEGPNIYNHNIYNHNNY